MDPAATKGAFAVATETSRFIGAAATAWNR